MGRSAGTRGGRAGRGSGLKPPCPCRPPAQALLPPGCRWNSTSMKTPSRSGSSCSSSKTKDPVSGARGRLGGLRGGGAAPLSPTPPSMWEMGRPRGDPPPPGPRAGHRGTGSALHPPPSGGHRSPAGPLRLPSQWGLGHLGVKGGTGLAPGVLVHQVSVAPPTPPRGGLPPAAQLRDAL